ncbi:MAG: response regulator [Vicinamibacterales bacterium]
MKRVLFVDDEQLVLDGLQNILRRQRRQWEMAFALGGEAALESLAASPVDVIVSDMLMPGMDGATLLSHVKERYPTVIRIVLSGHAEPEQVARVLPVSHQYLSKPCDAETLRHAIERACELREFVLDPAAREAVGRLASLPSVPGLYWELTRRVADPKAGPNDIADIVSRDPAMSAKLLQIVNSAYFGLAQRVTSIHQAVAYLGIELVRALALTAHIFSLFEHVAPEPPIDIERLQAHSLATALLARHLAPDPAVAEEAFAGGLLHDIGRLVLALSMSDRFAAAVARAEAEGCSLNHVEHEAFGVTHTAVGAYLLGVWGLPPAVVECAAHHHAPAGASPGYADLASAVHVADRLAHHVLAAPDGAAACDADAFTDGPVTADAVRRALAALTASPANRMAG